MQRQWPCMQMQVDSWVAPKAATFSSHVHAAHLRLPITKCNPLKLQTSHHIT